MGNIYMEASQINYRGGEKKMSVEEALKNTSGEAAAIAQLQSDVANLSDVKTNQITIAPTFSAETAYDPGDLVYYNGLSYRCVNAHEGEWDADDFAATTISNELSSLMSGLTVKTATVTDEHFSTVNVTEVGGVKMLYIATTGSDTALDTTADYVEYFTLPTGFRPSSLYYNRFISKKSATATDTDWVIRIDTTGKVSLVNYSGEAHPGLANTFVFI